MPDNIILSTGTPRPQQSWFSGAHYQTSATISQALGALENGAAQFTLASSALAVEPSKPHTVEQSIEEHIKNDQEQETHAVENLDFELVIGSLLDEISSVMDDIKDNRLTLNDQLVDIVAQSFKDIERHIDNVPEYLAAEVGELAADICDTIEAHGTSAQPIIALFHP